MSEENIKVDVSFVKAVADMQRDLDSEDEINRVLKKSGKTV